MNKAIRAERFKIACNICEYCHSTKATELHHIFSRKSEYIETVRALCSFCHRGSGYQERLNIMKVEASAELIEKYGEVEARKRAGGRLYFKSMITGK